MAAAADEVLPTTVTLACVASGESHTFTRRFRNIGSLKSHIEDTYDIPVSRQIIVHQGTLMMNMLKEFIDLRDASGRAAMEVYTKIEPDMVDVQVETPTGQLTIEIHSQQTITQLKRMIDEREGIPPRRQTLTVMGVEMNTNTHLVEDYVTIPPLTITLTEIPPNPDQFVSVNLINKFNDTRATVQVEGFDTIHTLHGLARRHGVAEGYDFYFVWNAIDDKYEFARLVGQFSLNLYGIENGANLYVNYDSMFSD